MRVAGDVELAGQVVRSLGHVETGLAVEQRDHQGVFNRGLAEPQALTRAADDEGRLRHVLHAAGQYGGAFVEVDLLGGVDGGVEAGAAEGIRGEGRHFLRDSCLEAYVACTVDGIARGLQGVANDDVLHFLRRGTAAPERFLRGNRGEVDGADVAELAVVFGHRRACAVDDDNVFHACSWTLCFVRRAFNNKSAMPATSTRTIQMLPSIPKVPPVRNGAPWPRVVITLRSGT